MGDPSRRGNQEGKQRGIQVEYKEGGTKKGEPRMGSQEPRPRIGNQEGGNQQRETEIQEASLGKDGPRCGNREGGTKNGKPRMGNRERRIKKKGEQMNGNQDWET